MAGYVDSLDFERLYDVADGTITKQQSAYIRERLAGKSQRKAYMAAFPSRRWWKPSTIDQYACRLEADGKISARLAEGKRKILELAVSDGIVRGEDVIRELARVAFANTADFVRVERRKGTDILGNEVEYSAVEIVPTDEVSEHALPALASVKQGANGIEIRLHPKVPALVKLGEHLGLFDSAGWQDDGQDDGFMDALKGQVEDIWDE
ncbi:MAG: terminase small subunit [Clostridiales Family XIII bacterium]|nr:terminase small subunit [Clostridiales Family XIII bacterium]